MTEEGKEGGREGEREGGAPPRGGEGGRTVKSSRNHPEAQTCPPHVAHVAHSFEGSRGAAELRYGGASAQSIFRSYQTISCGYGKVEM